MFKHRNTVAHFPVFFNHISPPRGRTNLFVFTVLNGLSGGINAVQDRGKQTTNAVQIACPACGSHSVQHRNIGSKVRGSVGAVIGASAGLANALGGAKVGAAFGILVGPAAAAVGGAVGALYGAMLGAATGCVSGAGIGSAMDQHIVSNCECLTCCNHFYDSLDSHRQKHKKPMGHMGFLKKR